MLKIKVYTVNRKTGERHTVRPERTLSGDGSSVFELSMALPPCRCPLHREHEPELGRTERGVGR